MFPNSFFCFVISFLNQWDFSRDLGLFLPSLYVQPRVTVLIACTDCPAGKWLSSTIHRRKDKTARQELNLRSCFLILTDRNYFFSYLVVFIKTIISLCSVKWWIFTSLLCSLVNFLHISHLLRWITVDCILMDLHQSHLRPRRIEEEDYKHSLSSIRPGSD